MRIIAKEINYVIFHIRSGKNLLQIYISSVANKLVTEYSIYIELRCKQSISFRYQFQILGKIIAKFWQICEKRDRIEKKKQMHNICICMWFSTCIYAV